MQPDDLLIIMDKFEFLVPSTVSREINSCSNYKQIQDNNNLTLRDVDPDLSEVLNPFFSTTQVIKGETEVISLAVLLYDCRKFHRFIMDDQEARKYVERHLNYLCNKLTGTTGFVGDCYCTFKYLVKARALELLELIENSQFRVTGKVLSDVRRRIECC